jgi:hypothetical protein
MDEKYFRYFLEKKDKPFAQFKIDVNVLNKVKEVVKDKNYFDFLLNIGNGGLFFKQSLHLYSFNSDEIFMSIKHVNNVIKTAYDPLFNNLLAFGQDIFGNQFVFDLATEKVMLFNCETGEKEVLADDFNRWLTILFKELDYYAGITYAEAWL